MAARSFYGCYLLRSLDPAARAGSYIGFTVNPRRRIRQHNGEICSGAWRTRRGRPWEMVLVVYGFPTQVQALQFEWAWQHPDKSKVVRTVVAQLTTSQRKGLKGKVQILMGMLGAAPWKYYPLTLQILAEQHTSLLKGCAPCPPHMPIVVAPMDQLPQPGKQQQEEEENEDEQQQLEQQQQSEHEGAEAMSGCSDDHQTTASQQIASSGEGVEQQQHQRRRRRQPHGGQDNIDLAAVDDGSCSSGSSDVVLVSDSSDAEVSIQQQASVLLRPATSAAVGDPAAASASAEAPLVVSKRRGKLSKQAAAVSKVTEGPRCGVCHRAMERFVLTCPLCRTEYHTDCLATALLQQQQVAVQLSSMPTVGQCLSCQGQMVWQDLLAAMKPFGAGAPAASLRRPRSRTKKKSGKARSRSSSRTKQQAEIGQQKGRESKQRSSAATEAAAAAAVASSSPKKQHKPSGSSKQKAAKGKAAAGKAGTGAEAPADKFQRQRQRQQSPKKTKASSGFASDNSSSSSSSGSQQGKIGRRPGGPHVVAAAAAAGCSSAGLHLQTDLPAFSDLAEHLAQQYPDLVLPSDLQQLGALLLGQDCVDQDSVSDTEQESQRCCASPAVQLYDQQQDWQQVNSCQQQHVNQEQQQPDDGGGVQCRDASTSFNDWLAQQQQQQQRQQSERSSDLTAPRDMPAAVSTPVSSPLSLGYNRSPRRLSADVVNLCDDANDEGMSPSPPPLLARLKLASPSGKRVRTAAETAAGISVTEAVAHSDNLAESSSAWSQDESIGRCAASRRLRLNGTTPQAMLRQKVCCEGTAAQVPGCTRL